MAKLTPTQILPAVQAVLMKAAKGKGTERQFLTAYQILERLERHDPALKKQLIAERTTGGLKGGAHYSAATLVAKSAAMVAEIAWLDTADLEITIGGQRIIPSNRVCGIFRIP